MHIKFSWEFSIVSILNQTKSLFQRELHCISKCCMHSAVYFFITHLFNCTSLQHFYLPMWWPLKLTSTSQAQFILQGLPTISFLYGELLTNFTACTVAVISNRTQTWNILKGSIPLVSKQQSCIMFPYHSFFMLYKHQCLEQKTNPCTSRAISTLFYGTAYNIFLLKKDH